MQNEVIFILLFVVATTVAIAVRRLNVPYTVALVLAGTGLGLLHAFRAPELTKELLFSLFLPGLLFEAAFHIEFKEFWRNRGALASLAVPGVVAATALTAIILTPVADALDFVRDFTWRHALVFGALISATDPVAVVAIVRNLGAPKRLAVLLDGESLLNDGTAIVFFTLSLAVAAGSRVVPSHLILDFFKIVGLGGGIGIAVGLVTSQVIKQVDEPMIEITLTTIAAYGSFVIAEQFHYSGVIATVSAGMLCGNYGARVGMSATTRVAVESFWEYVSFALNSMVFLLIGFEVNLNELVASWKAILVAYLVVILSRALVVGGVSAALRPTRERIPTTWVPVLIWGGLRGGLPMVLVLSLGPDFPHRSLLISMTFGVVVISILVHGLTMSPLLRGLGVVRAQEERINYEITLGRLQASHAAMQEIEEMSTTRHVDPGIVESLREEYSAAIEKDEQHLKELHVRHTEIREEELARARRQILHVEKERILSAFHSGAISRDVYDRLLAEVDSRLMRLQNRETAEPGDKGSRA